MGPCDYSDLIASSNLSDGKADQTPGIETVVIAWMMSCVAFPIIIFMGLWVWSNLLQVVVYGLIGLGFCAAGHYGTNNSIVSRLRYRTYTRRERLIIKRRLSE